MVNGVWIDVYTSVMVDPALLMITVVPTVGGGVVTVGGISEEVFDVGSLVVGLGGDVVGVVGVGVGSGVVDVVVSGFGTDVVVSVGSVTVGEVVGGPVGISVGVATVATLVSVSI